MAKRLKYVFLKGGYTTGCKELIDLLRQKSRPYIFSSTLSSSVVAAASKVYSVNA